MMNRVAFVSGCPDNEHVTEPVKFVKFGGFRANKQRMKKSAVGRRGRPANGQIFWPDEQKSRQPMPPTRGQGGGIGSFLATPKSTGRGSARLDPESDACAPLAGASPACLRLRQVMWYPDASQ
jgi:hypothetical protein